MHLGVQRVRHHVKSPDSVECKSKQSVPIRGLRRSERRVGRRVPTGGSSDYLTANFDARSPIFATKFWSVVAQFAKG